MTDRTSKGEGNLDPKLFGSGLGQEGTGTGTSPDEDGAPEGGLTDVQKSEIAKNKALKNAGRIASAAVSIALVAFIGYLVSFSGRISAVETETKNLKEGQGRIEREADDKFKATIDDILDRIGRLENFILNSTN